MIELKNYRKCATLAFAAENDISFYTENEPFGAMRTTKAGLVFVPLGFSDTCNFGLGWQSHKPEILRVENPYYEIIKCAEILNKPLQAGEPQIGKNTVVYPNASIYPNVKIGKNCVIHSGAVIGSRGFGFYEHQGKRLEVPHFGGVVIGDNCEIGANSVIAAGFLEPTVLGNGCKLDSLVQIGHNCRVGDNCVFCAQSGLAGSVVAEDGVTLAGGAQVAGHLTLGKGCSIAAKAGVTKSVCAGETVAGFPAVSIEKWRRTIARLRG